MKKFFSMRTKAEIIIVLMIVISVGVSAIPIKFGTDSNNITWIGTREQRLFGSPATFTVGILDTAGDGGYGTYYAINGTDGSNYTSGALAVVLNTLCDELYNGTAGGGTEKVYGGTIYLKQGRYNLRDQVRLKPGITIQGESGLREGSQAGTTISVYLDPAEGAAFYYDDDLYTGLGDAICIRNIQFACYGYDSFAYVYLKRSLHSRIEGCDMGFGNTEYCIYLDGAIGTFIENCDIKNAIYDGIYMNTSRSPSFLPCNDVVVRDSWVRGCDRDGIYIDEGTTEALIQGCAVVGNGRYDINCGYDNDGYGNGAQKCIFRDDYFGESLNPENDYPSIHLCDSKYNVIDGCYFHDSYFINSSYISMDNRYLLGGNVVSNCWMARYYNTTTNHSVWLNGNNTIIENCVMPGIRVDWGLNYTIRDCIITNDELGISLNDSYTKNATLIGNTVRSISGVDGSTTMLRNSGVNTEQISGLDYIFDNSSQVLKLVLSGTVSSIYGGDTSGDDLLIGANGADTYPYIQLNGNSWIDTIVPNGVGVFWSERNLADSGFNRLFSVAFNENTHVTSLSGGNVAKDNLSIYANSVDSYPLIQMIGNSYIKIQSKAGGVYIAQDGNNLVQFNPSGSDVLIQTDDDNIVLRPCTGYNLSVESTSDGVTNLSINALLHLTPISTPPDVPAEGTIYYDSDNDTVCVWTGAGWDALN